MKGKDDTVAVNLVTPEHENYGNEAVLVGRNMGGVELMAVLPDQGRLLDQLRSYLKTDLYIRQNSGGDDELLESILAARGRQNAERRRAGRSQKSNYGCAVDCERPNPLRWRRGTQNTLWQGLQELIRSAIRT